MNRPFGKDSYNDKEAIILELLTLSGKLIQKWNVEGDDEEIQWMLHHCTNPALKEVLKEITVSMLHVLEAIGQLEPVNGITISQKMNIPKGTVSKATRRLADKQLINSSTRPNNKKGKNISYNSSWKGTFFICIVICIRKLKKMSSAFSVSTSKAN
ncbi:MarR family transcriptional regulator [Virgibacillus halophilus]|uniref:MarR family transcriptional regulator n=1 Tax=Tigheibacillus halophilus TaxID=361280 RepID=A0ABU5C9H5_9BACI|nr:MarR family transcriptional regulator [Virgibacillus halophilus]